MALGIKCQFECTLGKDPEMKFTAGGKAFTKVSGAVRTAVKKDGDDSLSDTTWINLVFWDRAAEVVNAQLVKGDRISVTDAKFVQRSYEANDGTTKWVTEFMVYEFTKIAKLDWSNSGESQHSASGRQSSNNRGSAKPATSSKRAPANFDEDDDIPF